MSAMIVEMIRGGQEFLGKAYGSLSECDEHCDNNGIR